MDVIKLVKWADRIDQAQEDALLKEKNAQRLPIKDLMALPYDEYEPYLPARSNTMIHYEKGATTAQIWELGSKTKKTIKIHPKDGWYLMGPDGIPNGEPSSSSNPNAFYFWRLYDEAYEGLVSRGDFIFGFHRVVGCYYRPFTRFGVLCVSKGKRTLKPTKPDEALIWLKKTAKTNKNARKILKRLREGEA